MEWWFRFDSTAARPSPSPCENWKRTGTICIDSCELITTWHAKVLSYEPNLSSALTNARWFDDSAYGRNSRFPRRLRRFRPCRSSTCATRDDRTLVTAAHVETTRAMHCCSNFVSYVSVNAAFQCARPAVTLFYVILLAIQRLQSLLIDTFFFLSYTRDRAVSIIAVINGWCQPWTCLKKIIQTRRLLQLIPIRCNSSFFRLDSPKSLLEVTSDLIVQSGVGFPRFSLDLLGVLNHFFLFILFPTRSWQLNASDFFVQYFQFDLLLISSLSPFLSLFLPLFDINPGWIFPLVNPCNYLRCLWSSLQFVKFPLPRYPF